MKRKAKTLQAFKGRPDDSRLILADYGYVEHAARMAPQSLIGSPKCSEILTAHKAYESRLLMLQNVGEHALAYFLVVDL